MSVQCVLSTSSIQKQCVCVCVGWKRGRRPRACAPSCPPPPFEGAGKGAQRGREAREKEGVLKRGQGARAPEKRRQPPRGRARMLFVARSSVWPLLLGVLSVVCPGSLLPEEENCFFVGRLDRMGVKWGEVGRRASLRV